MKQSATLLGAACAAWAGSLLLACGTAQPLSVPDQLAATAFASADAYYALGRGEHAARHPDLALRAYELALQVDPAHGAARNGKAVLLAERGDYAGAIALWRKLVAQGAPLPAAERAFLLGNLGYALFLQGERDEALTVLQQACVLDPLQPLTWEHLAAVLETQGRTAHALMLMKQARTLRTHDLQHDYAVVGTPVAARPARTEDAGQSPWPADMARTEVHASGAALVEVRRVPAAGASAPGASAPGASAPGASAPGASAPGASAPGAVVEMVAPASALNAPGRKAAMRLEISNGNGVRGLAAAWARRLHEMNWNAVNWQTVRLTNTKPFTVPVTRIEYGADDRAVAQALSSRLGLLEPQPLPAGVAADLRIVLGRDQRASRPAKAAPDKPAGGTQAP